MTEKTFKSYDLDFFNKLEEVLEEHGVDTCDAMGFYKIKVTIDSDDNASLGKGKGYGTLYYGSVYLGNELLGTGYSSVERYAANNALTDAVECFLKKVKKDCQPKKPLITESNFAH